MGRYPKTTKEIDIKKQLAISEFSKLLDELPAKKVQSLLSWALTDISTYLKNTENALRH